MESGKSSKFLKPFNTAMISKLTTLTAISCLFLIFAPAKNLIAQHSHPHSHSHDDTTHSHSHADEGHHHHTHLQVDYSFRSDAGEYEPPEPDEDGFYWWKGNLHTHTLWSDGDQFPEWRGSIFTGGMSASHRVLSRVIADGTRLISEELLLPCELRIRDVRQGPDGFIYVADQNAFTTGENDGAVLRIDARYQEQVGVAFNARKRS
jgi:hypothetical protein